MSTPTAAYQIHMRVRLENRPGVLGRLATTIGDLGGNLAMIQGFSTKGDNIERDIHVNCFSESHQQEIVEAVRNCAGIEVLEWWDTTFHMHESGKISTATIAEVNDAQDLAMAYTPGVARVSLAIAKDPAMARSHTIKKNTVAVVTDGTAVLGLGNIGPLAALPVMEGKALLFKDFANVDAFPICLDTTDPDEIVETVIRIAPVFGGINLEDIAAPAAFEIEERLRDALDIPVFHDDQHGTAVVALAGLENALKLCEKEMGEIRVVISGTGAAGVAIGKILVNAGVADVVGVDRGGAIHAGRGDLNFAKQWFADHTNHTGRSGSLRDVLVDADVFIGVSGPGLLSRADIETMAERPIVFALANPDPEITPSEAGDAVAVMATGRSDYPNQLNNVLAFPGIFRGALDANATDITENMKLAAAKAIAESVPEEHLAPDFIVPSVFDPTVAWNVAEAVAEAAVVDGVVR